MNRFFFLLLINLLCFAKGNASQKTLSHYVLVSVSPHKFFVERIVGDTVKVGVMVPAGASAHSYEPSPKQMIAASKADLWFYIGEGFEARAQQALQSHHPEMKLIDLRQNLSLITSGHRCCHHTGVEDLHIWMSPKAAKIQAATMAQGLSDLYPENKELYKQNLDLFLKELDGLDQKIAALLQTMSNRTILVSHPAYAYFCRDYRLKQTSIEWEGRDPTPQQLTALLNEARQTKIKTIFIQPQYSNKGAKLVADVLGAKMVTLDPYSENYLPTMLAIAQAFAAG